MFCCSKKKNIQALVADNALVVSFLSGDAPRVWRGDMSQFLTASLEVQEAPAGKFSLIMKRGNGTAEEISAFASKDKAVEALSVISDALLQGSNGNACVTAKKGGWFKKLLKVIGVLLIAFVLLLVWAHKHMPPPGTESTTQQSKPVQTGVPAPADDILGK